MVSQPAPRRRFCYFRITAFFGGTDVQTIGNQMHCVGNEHPHRTIRRSLLLRSHEGLRLRNALQKRSAKSILQRLLYGHAHVEDLRRRLACGRGKSNDVLQKRRTAGSISTTQTQKILAIVKQQNFTLKRNKFYRNRTNNIICKNIKPCTSTVFFDER